MKSYRLFILLYFFLLLIFTNSYGQESDIIQAEGIHHANEITNSGEVSMIAEYRSVAYDYDITGNRTRRYLSIQSLKSGAINQQKEETESTLDWDKLGVKLYPNPTHGQLLLEFKNYPRGNLPKAEVYSLSGQQMVQQELSANPAGINIEGFPEGTYILKLWVGNEYRTYQIIKR